MAVPDDLRKVQPVKSEQELYTRRGQLNQQMELTQSALADIAEKDVNRIPERNFVHVFLPVFAGDEVNPYGAQLYPHWVNVAGNPYRPVDVVGPKGEVLFRVPPLLDRRRVATSTQNGHGPRSSISHMVASANQYAAMSPAMSEQYLSREFTQRAILMKVPHNVLEDLEAWNAIFVRYGRPPIKPMPADVATPNSPAQSKPKDDTGGVEIEFE